MVYRWPKALPIFSPQYPSVKWHGLGWMCTVMKWHMMTKAKGSVEYCAVAISPLKLIVIHTFPILTVTIGPIQRGCVCLPGITLSTAGTVFFFFLLLKERLYSGKIHVVAKDWPPPYICVVQYAPLEHRWELYPLTSVCSTLTVALRMPPSKSLQDDKDHQTYVQYWTYRHQYVDANLAKMLPKSSRHQIALLKVICTRLQKSSDHWWWKKIIPWKPMTISRCVLVLMAHGQNEGSQQTMASELSYRWIPGRFWTG